MTAEARLARTEAADRLCRAAWESVSGEGSALADRPGGMALVAVGGYGRRELVPWSGRDLVVLHRPDLEACRVGEGAVALWYATWDAQPSGDHSWRA